MTQRWNNGTVTTVEVDGDTITITDEGPLITNGKKVKTFTPDEIKTLIEEHDMLCFILARAARRAEQNAPKGE